MNSIVDPEIGKICITTNPRAKRVIARRKSSFTLLTVPVGLRKSEILKAIEELKPRLLKIVPKVAPIIDEDTLIDTLSFLVTVRRYNLSEKYKMTLKNAILTIFIPSEAVIDSLECQTNIKHLIESALRHEAKRILPEKTAYFAHKFGLKYKEVKINKSTSRWGSCSKSGNINYSYFLLLLSEKQINYVVMHELAHTVEMNHGPRFWHLLSSFCGEDAKAIARSLKCENSDGHRFFKD